MPLPVLFIICVFLLTGAVGVVHAEDTYELRQKKGLLLLEGFQQWAELQYRYGGHTSNQNNGSNSSSHSFEETYNFNLVTSVVDPHIFNSSLQGGVIYNQTRSKSSDGTSTGSDVTYQYNFNGAGLDRSPTPFSLLSYRSRITADNTYSSPTTNDATGYELGLAIKNSLLRSHFGFSHATADNRGGGGSSSTSSSNAFSYSADQSIGEVSTTSLSFTVSDQTGSGSTAAQSTSANSLNITNGLHFGALGDYSLVTSFQLINSVTDTNSQRNWSFSESLQARLGNALQFNASYSMNDGHSSDAAGSVQDNSVQQGEASLTHKLFSSVETTLRGRGTFIKLNDGTEDRIGGSGSIRYTKQLPEESLLAVRVVSEYAMVDRQMGTPLTTIVEELHAAVHQGDSITLSLGDGVLNRVVSVKSRNPLFTYVEGIDYTVNYILGSIDVRVGTGVRIDMTGGGTDLYVSYDIYKNPQEKYTSISSSVSSDLSLLSGKLQLGMAYAESRQTVSSGSEVHDIQDNSRSAMLYLGGKYDTLNYRISFHDAVSRGQGYRGADATATLLWDPGTALINLVLRDRYYIYDASQTASRNSENSGEVSLSYLKNVSMNSRLTLLTTFADLRSDSKGAVDSLSLRAVYLVQMNNSTITVSGQSAWSFSNGKTIRDDYLHVDFVRYF